MKIEHVRLAAALATVIEARGGDFRPICVDLKLKPRDVLAFSQGHHDFSAGTCRKIRTYLHLKHADVMRALGDDAPPAGCIEADHEGDVPQEKRLQLAKVAADEQLAAESIHAITCGCARCRAGSPA